MKKAIFFIGVLMAMLVINPAFAQAQPRYFLMISGIPGESTDKNHMNWINVFSFKEGVSQPSVGARATGGAASATRAQFADLTIFKQIDKASVLLKKYCATGERIKDVILSCNRAGKDQQEFYAVRLADVVVSGVKLVPDASLGILEEVTFSYARIEWKYTQQGPDGRPMGDVRSGFDLVGNRPF